jgi:hypothetical protein
MSSSILFDLFGIVTNRRLYSKLNEIQKSYDESFAKIKSTQKKLLEGNEQMAIDLTALIEQVTRNAEVDASAFELIVGLKTKVDELAADLAGQPEVAAKIAELAAALDASSDALADAVVANTPAAPEPIEPPVDEPVEETPVV